MSNEAMALESALLTAWELEGFLGQTRVRIPRAGNWPELDVLAFHPAARVLRIGEVKARFAPQWVTPLDEKGWADYVTYWLGFTEAVRALYPGLKGDVAKLNGLPPWGDLEEVEIWFVLNAWIRPGDRFLASSQDRLQNTLREAWGYSQTAPAPLKKVRVHITSTFEVVASVVEGARRQLQAGRGARFGDPLLDSIREVLRYLDPSLAHVPIDGDGMRLGPSKKPFEEQVRLESASRLIQAFGIADLFEPKVR